MLFNVLEGETVKIKISVWKECIRSVRGNILRMSRRKSGQESLFSSSKEINTYLLISNNSMTDSQIAKFPCWGMAFGRKVLSIHAVALNFVCYKEF